jgi:integrase
MLVRNLLGLIERDYRINGRRSFKSFVVFHWKHVDRLLGSLRAGRLTAAQIEKFKAQRLEEGAARGSVNLQLGLVRRGLRLAMRLGRIKAMPPITFLAGFTVREGFLTVQQFHAVHATLEALDPDAADVVAFLYSSGWRLGETLSLEWSTVWDDAIHLPAAQVKTGRSRTIPLVEPLASIIERRRAVRRGARIFHRSGKPIKSFRGAWRRACAVRGLDGILIHDTRRSFCRNCLLVGVSQREAMALGGWTSPRVWSRYAIADERVLSKALGRIWRLLSRPELSL